MSAGTLALTNNSTTVTGTNTVFQTDLAVNDFIVCKIGGTTYTLGVSTIGSNTALTLTQPFTGPSTSGVAWYAVPNQTLVGITTELAANLTTVYRSVLLNDANWMRFFALNSASVTLTLKDGSTITGPSWQYISSNKMDKSQNLNDVANKTTALSNIGAFPVAGGTITGALTVNGTTVLAGVTDGGDAATGKIGEYREASNAGVGLASSVFINIAAITLPAGDWDVEGIIQFNSGSATLTSVAVAINSTSSTGPGFPYTTQMPTTNGTLRIPSFKRRYSISSNTVIYLIGLASFSGSGATADGFMRARRIR